MYQLSTGFYVLYFSTGMGLQFYTTPVTISKPEVKLEFYSPLSLSELGIYFFCSFCLMNSNYLTSYTHVLRLPSWDSLTVDNLVAYYTVKVIPCTVVKMISVLPRWLCTI